MYLKQLKNIHRKIKRRIKNAIVPLYAFGYFLNKYAFFVAGVCVYILCIILYSLDAHCGHQYDYKILFSSVCYAVNTFINQA